jgi:hypothetical protein
MTMPPARGGTTLAAPPTRGPTIMPPSRGQVQ